MQHGSSAASSCASPEPSLRSGSRPFPALPRPQAAFLPLFVWAGASVTPDSPRTFLSAHRARPTVEDDGQQLLGLPRSGKQPWSVLPRIRPAASLARQHPVRAGAARSGAPACWLRVQGEQRPVHGALPPTRGGFTAAADLDRCPMTVFLHTPALPNQQTPHYSCHGN